MQRIAFILRHMAIFCALGIASSALLASCGHIRNTADTEGPDTLASRLARLYTNGRALQRCGNYAQAIDSYKKCVLFNVAHPESVSDSAESYVCESLMQLMNSYQAMDEPEACVTFLDSLRHHPTPLLRTHCMRDIYSVSAYAMSRTDNTREAETLADSALGMTLHNPTPERLFRDYAYAAAVCFSNPKRQDDVERWSLKAIEQARLCGNTSGAQYVTSMLGTLYMRNKRLPDALRLYKQSRKEARRNNDKQGEAAACNALTELYLRWRIPKYANTYASRAVALSQDSNKSNSMIATQALLLKGQVMQQLGRNDSAIAFYKKAELTCKDLPYTCGKADAEYAIAAYYVEHAPQQELPTHIATLQRVAQNATAMLRAKAYYAQAEGLFKLHKDSQAETALDSMRHLLHSFDPPQYISIDYKRIIAHYTATANYERVKQYTDDMMAEYSAESDTEIRTMMYDNIVELKAAAEEQKINAMRLELENNRLYIWMVIAAFAITMAAFVTWMAYRRKMNRTQQQLMQARLSVLLDKLAKLSAEKEMATKRNAAQQSIAPATHDIAEDMNVVSTEMLVETGETSFRQRFERIYPNFVPTLRENAPNIGRREELHCMLIALGQDTHQVATVMGINYRSANMARYRIRQKLSLDKDDNLEQTIKSML